MLSMTGYGKGEYKEGGIELTCEIKTVNKDVYKRQTSMYLTLMPCRC